MVEGCVGALKGPVQSVREQINARYWSDILPRYLEMGCSPGTAPLEIFSRRATCESVMVLSGCESFDKARKRVSEQRYVKKRRNGYDIVLTFLRRWLMLNFRYIGRYQNKRKGVKMIGHRTLGSYIPSRCYQPGRYSHRRRICAAYPDFYEPRYVSVTQRWL